MLIPDQIEFYNRWNEKADDISTNTIVNCIDKYITLFIIYNSLYRTLSEKSGLLSGIPRKESGDMVSATKLVKSFLGSATILNALQQTDNLANVTALVNNMVHFNIKLVAGVPQPASDAKLRSDISGTNNDAKVLALLEILYYIRCNIVHGHKQLAPYQVFLVRPIIPILSTINTELFNFLSAAAV